MENASAFTSTHKHPVSQSALNVFVFVCVWLRCSSSWLAVWFSIHFHASWCFSIHFRHFFLLMPALPLRQSDTIFIRIYIYTVQDGYTLGLMKSGTQSRDSFSFIIMTMYILFAAKYAYQKKTVLRVPYSAVSCCRSTFERL